MRRDNVDHPGLLIKVVNLTLVFSVHCKSTVPTTLILKVVEGGRRPSYVPLHSGTSCRLSFPPFPGLETKKPTPPRRTICPLGHKFFNTIILQSLIILFGDFKPPIMSSSITTGLITFTIIN